MIHAGSTMSDLMPTPSITLSIIAAVGRNRAIGRHNQLLWQLPGDLPRFKHLTMGHPVIMGRKTYESIGQPLPGRLNIVISRRGGGDAGGITVCNSLSAALDCACAAAPPDGEVFVIGGGDIYAQAIRQADRLYLTEVDDAPADADTFFPDYTAFSRIRAKETCTGNGLVYHFVERVRP